MPIRFTRQVHGKPRPKASVVRLRTTRTGRKRCDIPNFLGSPGLRILQASSSSSSPPKNSEQPSEDTYFPLESDGDIAQDECTGHEHQDVTEAIRKRWANATPAIIEALHGVSVPECTRLRCARGKCKPVTWTLRAFGKPGNMRDFGFVTFKYQSCQELAAVITRQGYFPSAPVQPTMAFSFDWLELYHLLLLTNGNSISSFVHILTTFLGSLHPSKDVPPIRKTFTYTYTNWVPIVEQAKRGFLESLQHGKEANAAPGTLTNQCIACFYRSEYSSENHHTEQTVNCADESLLVSTLCQEDHILPRVDTQEIERLSTLRARLKENYYLGIDCNSQHRRFAIQSPGQVVRTYRSSFADTSQFRIPMKRLCGSKPMWESLQLTRDPLPHLPVDISGNTNDNCHNMDDSEKTTSSDLIASTIYTVQTGSHRCPRKFLANAGNSNSVLLHEKPPSLRAFDETGLVGVVCRHGIPLRLGNLWRGENNITVVSVLLDLVKSLPANASIFCQYDIACLAKERFKTYINVQLVLNAFHAYAHTLDCQLDFAPVLAEGLACTDGEGVERMWSAMRVLVPIGRNSSPQFRQDILHSMVLHLAEKSNRDQPNSLARRYERIQRDRNIVVERLRGHITTQTTELEWTGYLSYLRDKFKDNKRILRSGDQDAYDRVNASHRHYPYTAFFAELCKLQPTSTKSFLQPGKDWRESDLNIWTNITDNHAKIRDGRSPAKQLLEEIGNSLGENLQFEDFYYGTPLWEKYFSEVCLVHSNSLRNRIHSEVVERQIEFSRVMWRFTGQAESMNLWKKINKRSQTLEARVKEYNDFIEYMKMVCPRSLSSLDASEWRMSPEDYDAKNFQQHEEEETWQYVERLKQFWEKDFQWTFQGDELRMCYDTFKLDRMEEEMELLRIEAYRFGRFCLDHLRNLRQKGSSIKQWYGGNLYIQNYRDSVRAFTKRAELFGLLNLSNELLEEWNDYEQHVFPERKKLADPWHDVLRPRQIYGDATILIDAATTYWYESSADADTAMSGVPLQSTCSTRDCQSLKITVEAEQQPEEEIFPMVREDEVMEDMTYIAVDDLTERLESQFEIQDRMGYVDYED